MGESLTKLNSVGHALWRDLLGPSEARKEPRLSSREAGGQGPRKVHEEAKCKISVRLDAKTVYLGQEPRLRMLWLFFIIQVTHRNCGVILITAHQKGLHRKRNVTSVERNLK